MDNLFKVMKSSNIKKTVLQDTLLIILFLQFLSIKHILSVSAWSFIPDYSYNTKFLIKFRVQFNSIYILLG